MDLNVLAIEYTVAQYFSSTAETIGFQKVYELLKESVEKGDEHPDLIPWQPFENWEFSALLEQIDSDIFALTALLERVKNDRD